MVKDDKRGHRAWWWVLPAAAGLALVAAAVLVALAGRTPSASAADCALTITKTADASKVPLGGTIKYTLTVTNTSTDTACAHVVVTDALSTKTDCTATTQTGGFVLSPGSCTAHPATVAWGLVSFAAAATATLTIDATVNSTAVTGDIITNTANVVSDEVLAPGVTSTPATSVTVNDCDLTISKDSDDDEVGEGGQIVYTINVENEGTADCEDVVITEDIPGDTDCTDTDVIESNSDVDIDDADGCDSSGSVTWDVDDTMEPGDEAEVEMTVTLTSGAEDGDEIDNEACVTSDDTDAATDICDTLTVDVEGVAATKTPTPGPTATAAPPTATVRPVVPPVVAPPAPTGLAAPLTGSGGSGSGGSLPLALALGLAGGCLLLLGGVAMLRRPR